MKKKWIAVILITLSVSITSIYIVINSKEKSDLKKEEEVTKTIEEVETFDLFIAADTILLDVHINLNSGGIYTNVADDKIQDNEPIYTLSNSDIKEFKQLLKEYQVLYYQEDYSNDEEVYDGIGWSMEIAFKDGSKQVAGGSGSQLKKVVPKQFIKFEKQLYKFLDARDIVY